MPDLLTLADVELDGRQVLVRADFNVPLADGAVADDFRLRAAVPTIVQLREAGAATIVCSHLGRPKGQPNPELVMDPVAARLGELGGFEVRKVDDVAGPAAQAAAAAAGPGDVVMLENTRFEPGETRNDPALADALAGLADLFVLDAFGTAHRAHASTVGVAERIPSVAGPVLLAEVEALTRLLVDPDRPYTVLLGGAKVSDKLGVMRSLLPKVDSMLVGGGMCFTLLQAEGYEIGDSLIEEDMLDEVRELLRSSYGGRIHLPADLVVAERFEPDSPYQTLAATHMPDKGMGLDIGPETAERFAAVVRASHSVFWNGPMGVFEWEPFAAGTEVVARAVADTDAFTVAGGGDSVAALRRFGLEDGISHVSTGGGAGLEYLEQGTLPGLEALERWAHGT